MMGRSHSGCGQDPGVARRAEPRNRDRSGEIIALGRAVDRHAMARNRMGVRHHVYIAYQPPGVFRATATSSLRSAPQPRGDLATSGPYSASKYGNAKRRSPNRRKTYRTPLFASRKSERDAAVVHRLARDPPEFSLEAAKETDRGVTRSTHPLETVGAIAEPAVGIQNGPKPVDRKHGGLLPIETETIGKGRSRARLDNDFVCPPHMVALRGQRDRGQD
jgi:hypothetical protein